MFDDNKMNREENMDQNTDSHYEYRQEKKPCQPQDHKRRRNKISTTGIAAAVALALGVVAGAGIQLSGNLAGGVFASESEGGGEIAAAGTVNENKANGNGSGNTLTNVAETETETDTEAPADTEAPTETEAATEAPSEAAAAEEIATASVDAAAAEDTSANTVADVAATCMPCMVAITNQTVEEVQDYFSGQTYEQEATATGSGVIVGQNDEELLILTNNHVVEDSESLTVLFSAEVDDEDDAVVEALVKGTDSSYDLAVVAVKLADIPDAVKSQIRIASIGDSTQLKLGEQVVAIGNALGYGQSVTSGYVSALNREVTVDSVTNYMIQTDAAINEGNSGGALLNMNGELVGINSVKAYATGVEGMGYAIPSETFLPILEQLSSITTRTKVGDDETQGYLGVTVVDVSDEAKELYNVPTGAFVYGVEDGSAADAAGLEKGDIITKVDGVTITTKDELISRMKYYRAGETVVLTIQSQEEGTSGYTEKEVTVTLGAKESSTASSSSAGTQSGTQSQDGQGQDSSSGSQAQGGSDAQGSGNENGSGESGNNDGNSGNSVSPFSEMFPDLFD